MPRQIRTFKWPTRWRWVNPKIDFDNTSSGGSSSSSNNKQVSTKIDWETDLSTNLPEEKTAHKLAWKCLPSPFRWGSATWSPDTCAWFRAHWTLSSCRFALVSRAGIVGAPPIPPTRNLQIDENKKKKSINFEKAFYFPIINLIANACSFWRLLKLPHQLNNIIEWTIK